MELRQATRLGGETRWSSRASAQGGSRAPARNGSGGSVSGQAGLGRAGLGQAGLGLVESLVALTLLSTVILALASGMLALLGTSRANAQTQRLESAVTAWTESAKVLTYVSCATAAYYEVELQKVRPTVGNAQVTQVEYWRPATPPAASAFQPPTPGVGDGGAQRLTLRVELEQQVTTAQIVIRQQVPPALASSTTVPPTTEPCP
jgi:hypothetical protein